MNKTKTRTGLSALFAVLLAIMIAVPAILQSGADAAVNRKRPTKATLTSVKATSYNKVSLKWKKSKNVTSYAVYYKASNSKKWVKIANVSSKKTGYTHKSSKKYPLNFFNWISLISSLLFRYSIFKEHLSLSDI